MTPEPSGSVTPGEPTTEGWGAAIAGVVETVVATQGPEGRWNQAALGVEPAEGTGDRIESGSNDPASAKSYGRTLTRRNLERTGSAYVQHTTDPLDFVEAALGVYQTVEPTLVSAVAWTRADVERVESRTSAGTEIVEWKLTPTEGAVLETPVPTFNRGYAATIEATVYASRLDVSDYETERLLDRLSHCETIVEATGAERTLAAFERIDEIVGWRDRRA